MARMIHVFDHHDFAVIPKPSGMSFHSETGPGFVVQAAELAGCPLYPVHRLDKMTSGLAILAKHSEAAAAFTKMFETRSVEKYYLALSLRKPKKKQGWIKGDMAKARRGDWKLLKTMENPAVTRFISTPLREGERAFLIKPYTGKTHQIRVALKSLGSPIAGDVRYADKAEAVKEARGYLHAYALRFTYNGEPFSFTLPPDEGERFLSPMFGDLLQTWQAPWEHFPEKR
ncbi:MAG: TIGR01621 family pseudouridine synthase [Campylobacterales bacterium]|nr:TIGR01621 family pseudouridine synthase [Campylobacterales bacterium]